jgi:hypothetical protein
LFAIAVSYAILALGWHFLSDVIGGFFVAAMWTASPSPRFARPTCAGCRSAAGACDGAAVRGRAGDPRRRGGGARRGDRARSPAHDRHYASDHLTFMLAPRRSLRSPRCWLPSPSPTELLDGDLDRQFHDGGVNGWSLMRTNVKIGANFVDVPGMSVPQWKPTVTAVGAID